MKDASFPLEEATRNLLAYDQLNDNKDYSYHLQKVDSQFMEDTTPLVLTEEVKTNVEFSVYDLATEENQPLNGETRSQTDENIRKFFSSW